MLAYFKAKLNSIRGMVIGGGGLLQPVFEPFWESVLNAEIPFALFGVGINVLAPHRPALNCDLLERIASAARAIHVRDNMTKSSIASQFYNKVSVGICPSVNYLDLRFQQYPKKEPSRKYLLHVVHPSDLRFSGLCPNELRKRVGAIASSLGMYYLETDNLCGFGKHLERLYASAALVITSRLHGAIFSYGYRRPFISIACDLKTRAFIDTHVQNSSYLDASNVMDALTLDYVQDVLKRPLTIVDQSSLKMNEERMHQILGCF